MASFHCGSQLLPVEIDASSRTFHNNGNDTKYCECPNASVKLRWPSPQISHSRYPSEGSRAAHCFHRLLGGVALRHWVIAHHRADFSPRFPGGQEGKRYHFALIQRGSGASLVFERIERAMDFGKDARCAVRGSPQTRASLQIRHLSKPPEKISNFPIAFCSSSA